MYVECYRFLIFVVTDSVYYKYQYRITYTLCCGLNRLQVYVTEIKEKQIFERIRWQLRIFESVFYKSLIRACSFDNFLAASQNARSCGQTINHRALRICKKRIQKVLMLSPFILINISSLVLSDSYNGTLFNSLHSVYVKRY